MGELVRVNKLGLVIPPQRLDCLGESCPIARTIGRCFVDEHHLYFPQFRFATTELAAEFRNHAYDRIRLPRCQHNSSSFYAIHRRFSGTRIPPRAVMERFLEEADLLQQLGNVSVKMEGLIESIVLEDAPRNTLKRRAEDYEAAEALQAELANRALRELEVLPAAMRQSVEDLHPALGDLALRSAA